MVNMRQKGNIFGNFNFNSINISTFTILVVLVAKNHQNMPKIDHTVALCRQETRLKALSLNL